MASWHEENSTGSIPRWVIALVIVGALFLLGSIITRTQGANPPRAIHDCIAPCTVHLPPDTQEDMFDLNYTWTNTRPSMPIVQVWRKSKAEMHAESVCYDEVHIRHTYTPDLMDQCIDDYLTR
jgi:hypothetical protein